MNREFPPDKDLKAETPQNSTTKIDISKTFSASLSNKAAVLLEAIEEIDRLIELRKVLSTVIQERIENETRGSQFQLSQLKPWQLGNSQPIEMRRLGIEREILSLSKERRTEEVRAWEHVVSLLKMRRQFLIEYQNLTATKNTLEGSAP